MKNHEIATHTLYHVPNPGGCLEARQTAQHLLEQLKSSRQPWLRHTVCHVCHVPPVWPAGGAHLLPAAWHLLPADLFQIVGMKLWLNQTAHIPLEKIRVRQPGPPWAAA